MSKIRSKPQFRKERSLFFIFSVMFAFIIATALVHRFYNPSVISATFTDANFQKEFGEVLVNGTKLNFAKRPADTLYSQPISIELITQNEPESLFVWQKGEKTIASKQTENRFLLTVTKYDEMVAEFRK